MKQLTFFLSLFLTQFAFGQDGPFYFMHNNIQREYYLHTPSNLPPNSPIVYALHGWGGTGESMMSSTSFNLLSDQNNFAVCYPTAMINGGNGNSGQTAWDVEGLTDVEFIQSLNDFLQNEYQFDVNRIFATGFSYGAEMCYHLAQCQTTNLFAAIAPVGGTMWPDINTCFTSNNTSIFVIHGTNDGEFNYDGGTYSGVGSYFSVNEIVSFWVSYNSCTLCNNYTLPDNNNDNVITEVTKYNNINTGDRVWLYKVNNGQHEWFDVQPLGNDDFSASQEIWNFFEQIGDSLNDAADCNDLVLDISGCTDIDANNYDPFTTVDDGSCEYSACEYTTVTAGGGSWPEEVSWLISDCDGNLVAEGSAPFNECIDVPENAIISMADSYSDGWNGNILTIGDYTFTLYNGSSGEANLGSCGELVVDTLGCTDPEANNYNPNAIEDDDSCEYGPSDCEVITAGGGSWPEEVSWLISDCDGNLVVEGGAPFNECIDVPENAIISMADSYNDGWNGNILTIGEQTFNLASGGSGEATLGSCDDVTDVYDCMDEMAINYNPDATIDDGSCDYEPSDCENIYITLSKGWSMIGFSCANNTDASTAFASIQDEMIIAKDGVGNAYLPDWDFNGIGDLERGYGYLIKVSEEIINYNICE